MNSPFHIAAQIIGAIAVLESLFIFISNRRERLFSMKIIQDALWCANNLLMGGYTGALINFINLCRETVFMQRGKRRWAEHRWWLALFLVATLLSPALELWQGFSWMPLMPMIGSGATVVALYQKRLVPAKTLAILGQIPWTVYHVLLHNPTGVICTCFTILSAAIGLVNEFVQIKKKKKTR